MRFQIAVRWLFSRCIESKRVIDIDEFVPKKEIDDLYLNSPYYIAPDGEVGQQAFAVIREAIRKEGMVAIGKVVFTSREHIIALEARGKGLLGIHSGQAPRAIDVAAPEAPAISAP